MIASKTLFARRKHAAATFCALGSEIAYFIDAKIAHYV